MRLVRGPYGVQVLVGTRQPRSVSAGDVVSPVRVRHFFLAVRAEVEGEADGRGGS